MGRLAIYGFSAAAGPDGKRRLWRAAKAYVATRRYHPLKLMGDNTAIIGVHLGHLEARSAILATSRCKIELREANPANSRAGGQPLSAGFRVLPAIRQRVNDARNSHGLRCQVPADVD